MYKPTKLSTSSVQKIEIQIQKQANIEYLYNTLFGKPIPTLRCSLFLPRNVVKRNICCQNIHPFVCPSLCPSVSQRKPLENWKIGKFDHHYPQIPEQIYTKICTLYCVGYTSTQWRIQTFRLGGHGAEGAEVERRRREDRGAEGSRVWGGGIPLPIFY